MQLRELIDWLDTTLDAHSVDDYGPNGLQVEASDEIRKVALGVTSNLRFIEAAAEWLKHDQYAAKPSKSDRDTLPPRNFAQKQESQQYHEQWPRKLQRHGIRENQVRDPEKETIIAACSPKPALEVHTGALGPDHIDAVFRN